MPYKVQFIGLICFQPAASGQGRRALLPDGRFPEDPAVQPHVASISVDANDLLSFDGWRDDQVTSDGRETEFLLSPSEIALPFGGTESGYSETNMVERLPRLSDIDPKFNIDDNANWIGSVLIEKGEIEAVRFPGLASPPLISELRVPHDDEIAIRVTARKGWPTRTIVLKPGSEVAIINISRGLAPRSQSGDHFQIYTELSSVPVTLRAPKQDNSGFPESTSRHPTFRQPRPATFSDDCINTRS